MPVAIFDMDGVLYRGSILMPYAREAVDLFAYPDQFPDDWRTFRRTRLSALMARL